jgi:hypothetical protein
MKCFGPATNTITSVAIFSKRRVSRQKDGHVEHAVGDLIAQPTLAAPGSVTGNNRTDVWIHLAGRDMRHHRTGVRCCDAHQSHRLQAIGQRRILHPRAAGESLEPQPAGRAERSVQRRLFTGGDLDLGQILDKCVLHLAPIGIAGGDLRFRRGECPGHKKELPAAAAIVKSRDLCYGGWVGSATHA